MKKVSIGGTVLKIVLGTVLLFTLGIVAFLSKEIQPDTHNVTKTLDNARWEEKGE